MSNSSFNNYAMSIQDGDPAGDEPCYLDEFESIKIEIEKLSGCDFEFIENRARFILAEKSKDIRVCGYLLLSLTFNKGIIGLVEGLTIINSVIKNFHKDLHPQRIGARLSAIKWLNQTRLESFIKNDKIEKEEDLNIILNLIKQFNILAEQLCGAGVTKFTLLNSWLKEQQSSFNAEPTSPKVSTLIKRIIPTKPKVESKQQQSYSIDNEKQFVECTKNIISFCKNNNKLDQQLLLARILRWQNIETPMHNNYITQLPEPRKEGLIEIEKVLDSNEPQQILMTAESIFFEGCSYYLLDLQFYVCMALEQMEFCELKKSIEFLLKQMIIKNPTLTQLKFKNNYPFANEQTKVWLQTLLKNDQEQVIDSDSRGAVINNHITYIQQAKLNAASKQTSDIISKLKQLPSENSRDKIEKEFAIAQLISIKDPDLGSYYYQNLLTTIEDKQMAQWLPELAVEILFAYKTVLLQINSEPKILKHVTKMLCCLAPEKCFQS